ncbi:hypothetical protein [Polyangium spumosum]|uniref:Uncharacterized protein n=1 Tax=Polyangium spumosum TaxID=889282 RepID=A0A6N7PG79_9BACT|nr:hypothetical protein [Polyangium spumosum]MRG91009.1 hypothetical protein [Polyangium spumosum]
MASNVRTFLVLVCIGAVALAGCGEDGAPSEDDAVEVSAEEMGLRDADEGAQRLEVMAGERSGEATIKPWSSWWFPTWDDFLFAERDGELSPLQKYDRYSSTVLRKTTTAAAYERENLYGRHASSWSGLCYAWALASILEPEPKGEVTHGSLHFAVGDLKALLLKTYEAVKDPPTVGDRNDGAWDDEYEDILPHVFHRVLVRELFQKQRPFIMDKDAGYEVWNVPVYKAITKIERDASARDVVHVRTVVFVASPDVESYDHVGTEATTREYTYDLRGVWVGDRFLVREGAWTENSRWDHPDFLILPPDRVTRASFNPEIDIATVDAILERRR